MKLQFEPFKYNIIKTGFSRGETGGCRRNPGKRFDMVSPLEMNQWINDSQNDCGFKFFTNS